jgi:hypothetical protein|tara:strand:+ start:869 stop:2203 length:1335 start_codon:yes stop_codon:yes gene_type:complete
MSKRKQFRRLRDLQDNLRKYNAFSVYGYFPLFDTINDAVAVSPVSSYHIHEFEDVEYYMPDGLEMGKTQFHGDYKSTIKLNSDCSECDVLVVDDSYYMYKPDTNLNSFSAAAVDITNYPNPVTGNTTYPNFGHSVGMFGNKIFAVDGFSSGIFEWQIDYNGCVAKHINTYYVGHGGDAAGACMKDANTFLTGSTYMVGNPSGSHSILEIDISNPSPTLPNLTSNILFNLPKGLQVAGDISYVASTGTILAFLRPLANVPGSYLYHFDYNGNVLDSVAFVPLQNPNPQAVAWSLFHYKGKEYFSEHMSGDVYEIIFNPLSYTSTNFIPMGKNVDAASSPGVGDFRCSTSWECVQKGNHPKFGFECKKIQGLTGQYATKQECIDSGCEGINPGISPAIGNVTPPIITTPTQPIQPRLSNPENEIEEPPIVPSVTRTGGGGSGSESY